MVLQTSIIKINAVGFLLLFGMALANVSKRLSWDTSASVELHVMCCRSLHLRLAKLQSKNKWFVDSKSRANRGHWSSLFPHRLALLLLKNPSLMRRQVNIRMLVSTHPRWPSSPTSNRMFLLKFRVEPLNCHPHSRPPLESGGARLQTIPSFYSNPQEVKTPKPSVTKQKFVKFYFELHCYPMSSQPTDCMHCQWLNCVRHKFWCP